MPNARVLRDIKARNLVKANEVIRRAYLYVARNETLSPQVRHQAQLQLNTFGKYTRPTTVKNRCSESGRGRGIISEFALCRVRDVLGLFRRVIFLRLLTVPVPTEGTQAGTPWRAQSFLVDGGYTCIRFHGRVSFSSLLGND
jgi:small subunit ribosomal protein S14